MLIVHLFASYAHINLFHLFPSSWCQGSAATSACGSSLTFLFTFLHRKMQVLRFLYLCGFLVYTTGNFMFKVFMCSCSSCFGILFSIVITLLGEKGASLCASRAFACLF